MHPTPTPTTRSTCSSSAPARPASPPPTTCAAAACGSSSWTPRRELGHSWRSRWDSLRLFTPAQYDGLPGCRSRRRPTRTPPRTRSPTTWRRTPRGSSCRSCWAAAVRRLRAGRRPVRAAHLPGRAHRAPGRRRHRPVPDPGRPRPGRPARPGRGPAAQLGVPQPHRGPGRAGGRGRRRQLRAPDRPRARHHGHHQVTLAVGTESIELPQRLLGRDLFWWLTEVGVITKTADSRLARRMRARRATWSSAPRWRSSTRPASPSAPASPRRRRHGVQFDDGDPVRARRGRLGDRVPARTTPGSTCRASSPTATSSTAAAAPPVPGAVLHRPAVAAHPRLRTPRLRPGHDAAFVADHVASALAHHQKEQLA